MKTPIISTALALISLPCLLAQDIEVDPSTAPKVVRVQTEFIELTHKELSRLLMVDDSPSFNATKLRMKAHEMVEADQAKIIETQVLHARSGEISVTESISEYIYPTEYDIIPIQPSEGVAENTQSTPSAAAPVATAFETRNVGTTIEIEPTIGENGKLIDLRFVTELVAHTGNNIWREIKDDNGNINRMEMPNFYTMRVNNALTCVTGQYCLVAVLSPKDDEGNLDTERKVMAFIKCTVLPVMPSMNAAANPRPEPHLVLEN